MILRTLAAILLLAALWSLFRLAMGLRWAKLSREEARGAEESRGRRVVAEVPWGEGDLIFFLEDEDRFYWGGRQVRKPEILGARMLLNGGVIGSFSRGPVPDPQAPVDYEGRERWEVLIHLEGERTEVVPCGSLREGVSREIATRVFGAIRQAVAPVVTTRKDGTA